MEVKNVGRIMEIKDGIAIANGLSEVGANEIVNINTREGVVRGMAFNLEEDTTGIVVIGDYKVIEAGDMVEATSALPEIEVSEALIGKVLNGIGEPIDGKELKHSNESKNVPIESIAAGVIERKDVDRPLQTGILAIDALTPIGKGQRQLIIGDRQTGKTAIGLDAILNQKGKDVVCIYVGIGQKASKIAQIHGRFEQEGVMDYTIIISASASDTAAMQFMAPYIGTAIAEYFTSQGKDTLIIYDDLSKHAWAYREISLLLRRPPGREAYPGDIFYLHSRLLERSVQLADELGGGSITSLPIIETQAGDVSAYIATNVISITDGQIYLESKLFNAGQKPAINVGLSVSRVGSAAQVKPMKQVSGELRLDLAQYRELAAFAELGSDLDVETQKKLDRGARMVELLKQDQFDPIDVKEQILILYAGSKGYIDGIEVDRVKEWKEEFKKYLVMKHSDLLNEIDLNTKIEGELETRINKVIEDFIK